MRKKKQTKALEDVRKVLGEDFWEDFADVLPFMGPKVDMYRGNHELIISIELPGLQSQNDISVTVQGYSLIVEGEIIRPYAVDEDRFILDERTSGRFKRKLRLPKESNIEQLQADFWNGLLVIRVPLSAEDGDGTGERINIHFHS